MVKVGQFRSLATYSEEEDVAAAEIAEKNEAEQIFAEEPEEGEEQDPENPDDLPNFAVFGVPLNYDKKPTSTNGNNSLL
ncbi:hypothetical protein BV898_18225 [Hypsibius exemplaris]|uniref:Uncharacterized protein n=1 Tax=Hypsibius exemplaris TaxID=2072580 RepID=A0A9X6NGU6_HYPEX|nr:hypothetical protein BV898_18225 [Hypsibius exemplaris]